MQLGALLICAACGSSHKQPASTARTADFVETSPRIHVHPALVASPEQKHAIEPLDAVTFAHDRAAIDEASADQIDTAAKWLRRHPRVTLVLEGHADATGVPVYNEDLAMRRMVAVRDRMVQHGIAADRIMLVNFGDREAMDERNELMGADRKVVLYATKLSPQAVAAMVRENRQLVVAVWMENGALMQLREGQAPTRTVVGGR
jgi:peptidoglycan-associated lipoprotein